MNNFGKKLIVLFLVCAICIPQICFAAIYDNGGEYTWNGKYYTPYKQSKNVISIAFTGNMNGNFSGEKEGGLARAVTAMKDVRKEYPDSYLFDTGNFSAINDIFSNDKSDSYPLEVMSKATYDAAGLGYNELVNDKFTDVIAGASDENHASGEMLPQLIASNSTLGDKLANKVDKYGSDSYKTIEKYNSKIAIFSINDSSKSDDLKSNDVTINDAVKSAQDVMDKLENKKVDLVVCMYAGEKQEGKDPAEEIAKNVKGIDLIISGTSTAEDSKTVEGTTIVGTDDNATGLGQVIFTRGERDKDEDATKGGELKEANTNEKFKFDSYKETKLDSSIEEYEPILDLTAKHQNEYFKKFGLKSNSKLADNEVEFTPISDFGVKQGDDNLGNYISDSYLYVAGKEKSDEIKGTCSVVASGAVKNSIKTGKVTPSAVFSMFEKDAGADKLAGIDLIKVYVTGAELRLLGEVDASLSTEDNGLRLYTSGLGYEYNPNRFYLNHISDYWYQNGNEKQAIDDEALYALVMDTDTLKILQEGNSSPFGLLDIKYKDEYGDRIEDFDKAVIKDKESNMKAWLSVANYMYDNDVSSSYEKPANHKVLNDSSSLADLFSNPGKSFIFVTCVGIIGLALLILVIIFVIFIIRKILKVPSKSKYSSLYKNSPKQAPIFKHRRNRYRDRTRKRFK